MAQKQILINGAIPDQEFTIELDGSVYLMRVRENARTGRFVLDVKTEAGDEIVMGVVLVSDWAPLSRFKDLRMPLGDLYLGDVTGKFQEPNRTNLSVDVLVFYEEAA